MQYKQQADPLLSVHNYTPIVISGNDKIKHLTLLKVPKCEIFDRSDFNDFYTIKSLREGDCWVKI